MAVHKVDITGSSQGAYNRVRSALKGYSYEYEDKVFTFEGDADLLASVQEAAGVLVEGVLAEGVSAEDVSVPSLAPHPEHPELPFQDWVVVAGDKRVTVTSQLPPAASMWAEKLEEDHCSIADSTGNVVASWSA